MGVLYFAVNHKNKAAFELGKTSIGIKVRDIKVAETSLEDLTSLIWGVIDPSLNFTKGFTEADAKTYAEALLEFNPDAILSDSSDDVYDKYGDYIITHSVYTGSNDIGRYLDPTRE